MNWGRCGALVVALGMPGLVGLTVAPAHAAGTELHQVVAFIDPAATVTMGGRAYFSADDGIHGRELWTSDGTSGGTRLLEDAHPGSGSSVPTDLVVVGSQLYFTASDDIHGRELWTSDGTPSGTRMVKDIAGPHLDALSGEGAGLTALGGEVYFAADDGVHGRELWRSDGSEAGTVRVGGSNDTGSRLPPTAAMAAVGSTLYFAADPGGTGYELWAYDATDGSAGEVADLYPGTTPGEDGPVVNSSTPAGFVADGSTLYFVADDGTGPKLWKIVDGTPSRVTNPAVGSDPTIELVDGLLAVIDHVLYFAADDGETGTELWRSDGTPGGTRLVTDLEPDGPGALFGVSRSDTAVVDGTLYFAAADKGQLWSTDGTAAGTHRVADLSPSFLAASGSTLFLTGDDGTGAGLWVQGVAEPSTPPAVVPTTKPGCTAATTAAAGAAAQVTSATVKLKKAKKTRNPAKVKKARKRLAKAKKAAATAAAAQAAACA
ncbi:ELWxxDGT repeat protein [Nocardioides nitrophenolicus]|uniref:ELWxxDGT repeat protein n=1 Tax=Nocardioides nitrophenolicus TaxID=60489 RepID=UPI00195A0982|nr:ELWxxDGT repeat protein [Nocardioides nitrophenolicus]MBM7518211.1 ELWxxDGT repeat protein [Nocardioides nitrophenolicus]